MSLRLRCPDSMKPHVARVLQGEYDVDVEFPQPPRILDIGANVGAFAIWASRRWPGAHITCYEPHPDTFAMLWRNVGQHATAECIFAAVVDGSAGRRVKLYEGLHNCGEASTKLIGEQDAEAYVYVPTSNVYSHLFPEVDVLKVDAEGVELELIDAYVKEHGERLSLILLEAHGEVDKLAVERLLVDWTCIKSTQTMPNRWTMGFRREP